MSNEPPEEFQKRKADYYRSYDFYEGHWHRNFDYMQHSLYGFPLGLAKNVYYAHPFVSFSPDLPMMYMGDLSGKDVLDVGCGSGVISIMAAYNNASSVVACDISEEALRLSAHNAQMNNLTDRITFLQSDVLDNVIATMPDKKFDLVIANLWYPIIHDGYSEEANTGPLKTYDKFLSTVRAVMKPEGIAYLTSSEFTNVEGTAAAFDRARIDWARVEVERTVFYQKCRAHMYSFDANGRAVHPLNMPPSFSQP